MVAEEAKVEAQEGTKTEALLLWDVARVLVLASALTGLLILFHRHQTPHGVLFRVLVLPPHRNVGAREGG